MADVTDVLETVVEHVFGIELPKGDVAGCRAAAYRLRQLAEYVDDVNRRTTQGVNEVSGSNTGRTIAAFQTAATTAGTHMTDMIGKVNGLADLVDEYADEVEKAKQRVAEQFEQIAASVTVGVLYGFVSDGVGDLLAAPKVIAALTAIVGEMSAFGEAVATLAARVAFYSLDATTWGITDRASQNAIAAANGDHPVNSLDDLLAGAPEEGDARTAYNVANDGIRDGMGGIRAMADDLPGPLGRVARMLPTDPRNNLTARAWSRFAASSLAYEPVLNYEQGKSHLLPDESELYQKAFTNLIGRKWVDQIRGVGK